MVGAVLVQRTTWANAKRSIERLRVKQLLQCDRLEEVDLSILKELVRPAGFFRAKAACLKNLAGFVHVIEQVK